MGNRRSFVHGSITVAMALLGASACSKDHKESATTTTTTAGSAVPGEDAAKGVRVASCSLATNPFEYDIYGGLLGNEAGEMQGGFGFGRAGFGPGGGGTGWGTIGTGRYGTIGHGSGTGSGYGVGGGRGGIKGRTASVPEVRIGQPSSVGDLDKAIIRRYIKRSIQKISYCYEKQLLAKPGLAGTLATQFLITSNGTVQSANASGVDPDVASCVAGILKNIQFPKPKGGGSVQVSYPFTFHPGSGDDDDDDAEVAAPAADPEPPALEEEDEEDEGSTGTAMALDEGRMGKKDSDRAEGQYKMKSRGDDPQLARAQALEAAKEAGILGSAQLAQGGAFASITGTGDISSGFDALDGVEVVWAGSEAATEVEPYVKATVAPALTAAAAALGACTSKTAATARGSVRASFGVGPDAKILAASAEGIGDLATEECVAGVIRSLKVTAPARGVAVTCDLVFTEPAPMRVTVRTGDVVIDVSAKRVQVGKLVIDAPVVDAQSGQIAGLREGVQELLGAATNARTIIRATADADGALLEAVRVAVLIAGGSPIIAVETSPGVAELIPTSQRGQARDTTTIPDAEPPMQVSILLQVDVTWVGVSRMNEFRRVDGADLGPVTETLAEWKKLPGLTGHAELAAETGVSASRIAEVAAIVRKAGFAVTLTSPHALSARPTL